MNTLNISGKRLKLPVFFPDATKGVIKSLTSEDLKSVGVQGLIVNTFHLFNTLGISRLKKVGGIKHFTNWDGAIISDSGGFQVLSLIYDKGYSGSISNKGIRYTDPTTKKKYLFTPEKSIRTQLSIKADILICLDDCPKEYDNYEKVRLSVLRTIEWAKRCKEEYIKLTKDMPNPPLLFGVIQGGNFEDLRKLCADQLKEIGFAGFGFGGWPLDEEKNYNYEILEYTCNLMPNDKPKYALGVGNPLAIKKCIEFGYNIFDCVLPTRDGRHGRLYKFTANPLKTDEFYNFLHIKKSVYSVDNEKISDYGICKNYSLAYLHHLFAIKDISAARLASLHNLGFYIRLLKFFR